MRTGYLCIASDQGALAGASHDPPYQGVVRRRVSDEMVDRYEEFKTELLDEWNRATDDEWFAFLPTAADAQTVAAGYARRGIRSEVVKVTLCESESDAAIAQERGFLGFDVASLNLEESLLLPQHWFPDVPDGLLRTWLPIWRLERGYVDDHLNPNGLLDSFEAARVLRDAVTAMQGLVNPIVPGTFLDVAYKVLAVSRAVLQTEAP